MKSLVKSSTLSPTLAGIATEVSSFPVEWCHTNQLEVAMRLDLQPESATVEGKVEPAKVLRRSKK